MTANTPENTTNSQNIRPNLALSLHPEKTLARSGLAILESLAEQPAGSPTQHLAAKGLAAAIEQAIRVIGETDSRPPIFLNSVCSLVFELEGIMEETDQVESQSAVDGLKSKYPAWWALSKAGSQAHHLGNTYLGLKVLKGLHEGRPLRPTTSSRWCSIVEEEDLSQEQILALLSEPNTDDDSQLAWLKDLQKSYRDVLRAFSPVPEGPPPKADLNSKVTSQLADGTLAATAARRAGARNHREVSHAQMSNIQRHITLGIQTDTFIGCLGVLTGISGFTPDLIKSVPIALSSEQPTPRVYLDVKNGILQIDHTSLIPQAATAIDGCRDSSNTCSKPLPAQLSLNLQRRLRLHPDARTVGDLYPECTCPAGDASVYPSQDAISPSWARYRNSLGSWLRHQGFDNLMASTISSRFWHVPKSKLYYSTLSHTELQAGFNRFYSLAGWGDAVALETGLGFGCKVVPNEQSMLHFDQALLEACIDKHPGKNGGLKSLIEYHNSFIRLNGFRLSVLLTLREAKSLLVPADFNERTDRWLPMHDKDVAGRDYPLPMPISVFLSETVSAIRAHNRAMRGRLIKQGEGKSALAKWCFAVFEHKPVPLLMVAKSTDVIRDLGTRDVLHGTDRAPIIPPDFGRKFMENALREEGLRSTEVDAFLRHAVVGQAIQSSTGHHHSMSTWLRTTLAVDRIAQRIFGQVAHGLAKG